MEWNYSIFWPINCIVQCVFSCVPKRMQSHTGRIYSTFPLCVFRCLCPELDPTICLCVDNQQSWMSPTKDSCVTTYCYSSIHPKFTYSAFFNFTPKIFSKLNSIFYQVAPFCSWFCSKLAPPTNLWEVSQVDSHILNVSLRLLLQTTKTSVQNVSFSFNR